MNHPTENELLLLAYGESPHGSELESHVAMCETCRLALAEIEHGRVALDLAVPAGSGRRGHLDWAPVALAAAAVLAAVFVTRPRPAHDVAHWAPTTSWSTTAGYVTGQAMAEIDAQLTRLEQERSYGFPN